MRAQMEGPVQREGETAIALGEIVAGRYRVLAPMGAGGMATVHRAEDVQTGRRVALKVLRPEIGRSGEAVERLRREAEILAHLRHPAIVAVERSGTLPNGQFFLCMELLEGETLGDRLRRGRIDIDELAPIVAGATAGLAAAHDLGVVHRDLKPDNIYLAQGAFGAPLHVKLLDFGISKVIGFDRITRTGQVLGTPRYMAPEQLTADRDLDARVDVYALGVILYEALAGQPPFAATDPSALIVSILGGNVVPLRSFRPDLPPEVEALVARAMARAPEARHGSAIELGAAFAELAASVASGGPGSRSQMRTSALGAMSGGSSRPPPANAPLAPASPEPFKPSTFSEFAAVAAPPREPVAPTPVSIASEDPEAVARGGSPVLPRTPEVARVAANAARARPVASRGSRGARVVAGLVGAAVLALVLVGVAVAWYLDGGADAPSSAPRPSPGPSTAPAAPPSADIVAGGAPMPSPIVAAAPRPASVPAAPPAPPPTLPSGLESPAPTHADAVPTTPTSRPAEPRAEAPPRRAPEPRPTPPPEPPSPAAEEAVPPPYVYEPAPSEGPREETATDLIRSARERQRSGDMEGCIELGLRAIDLGAGPTAQLLLGDCYLASGQTDRAGKAYERFCRAMPSHPAVLRVMDVVASTGGRCE